MKFLCVECDEPMALRSTSGPDNGSMTVLFGCDTCGREIAMLTNSMETQMVHSLGVKIGGAKEKAPPMETIRSSLIGHQGGNGFTESTEPSPTDSSDSSTTPATEPASEDEKSAGGCPFSAMISGTEDVADSDVSKDSNGSIQNLQWTPEAEERMERIPAFIRPMVERGIEDYAKANHATVVDEEMLKIVREKFGF